MGEGFLCEFDLAEGGEGGLVGFGLVVVECFLLEWALSGFIGDRSGCGDVFAAATILIHYLSVLLILSILLVTNSPTNPLLHLLITTNQLPVITGLDIANLTDSIDSLQRNLRYHIIPTRRVIKHDIVLDQELQELCLVVLVQFGELYDGGRGVREEAGGVGVGHWGGVDLCVGVGLVGWLVVCGCFFRYWVEELTVIFKVYRGILVLITINQLKSIY